MSAETRGYSLRPLLTQLNRSRLRKPVMLGTAFLLAGTGYGIYANGLIWFESRGTMHTTVANVPAREVAIVLGAKVHDDGTPSAVLADRLRAAERLYKAGKVKKIIVSGDHMAKEYNEPLAMFRFLTGRGIPEGDIFMDHAGFRTFDSMVRAKKVFGVNGAVICTQRFHLGRAIFLARHFGIDAVGLESDLRRYRHHVVNLAREFTARSFALLDVYLLGTEPSHLGPLIPLSGDARITHDSEQSSNG